MLDEQNDPNDDPKSDNGGPETGRPESYSLDRPTVAPLDARRIEKAIQSLAIALDLRIGRDPLRIPDGSDPNDDPLKPFLETAEHTGIFLREVEYQSEGETFALVQQGYPVVFVTAEGTCYVLQYPEGRVIEVSVVSDELRHESLASGGLKRLIGTPKQTRMFVAQKELQCETMAGHHGEHSDGHHGEHAEPLQRFIALLDLDRRDISLVILFALVAGVLGLATPLVIESLVNVVSWGIYFQPLLVLAGMLLVCLGIAGVLKVLQTWVVEIIQRRQFVRIVSDLSHRFPRANQKSLEGEYPRELANRVFDIMTIQKATATLLLDGVSIALTTVLGLFLLAFYHPFLLGFDIVLVIAMIGITWLLGRGGIRTAIEESKTKYAVAHWLQDVISMPAVFKVGGGEDLAIRRANQLTAEYVRARKRQFGVVIRQVIFAVSLQVVASTALLGLGGWLVINGQLTLGQLVASELVVTVVVGAFAKAGKSLEKFYDMMAGIDKVGHLIDVPPDPRTEIGAFPSGPVEVMWSDLVFPTPTGKTTVSAGSVAAGSCAAIVGDNHVAKTLLARSLAGLVSPPSGTVQVAGYDAYETSLADAGQRIGYAGPKEIFHGTIRENVDLGRPSVTQNRVRDALRLAALGNIVLSLPDGLDAHLQTDGYPLNVEEQAQLMIARAVATEPNVLVIDGLLDSMRSSIRDTILDNLAAENLPWTLVIITHRDDIAQRCNSQIAVWKRN